MIFMPLHFLENMPCRPKRPNPAVSKKMRLRLIKKIRLTLEKTALLMYVICREINFPFRELKTAELQHK